LVFAEINLERRLGGKEAEGDEANEVHGCDRKMRDRKIE
jgi:hypothetical protein